MKDFFILKTMLEKAKEKYKHFSFGESSWGQELVCFEIGQGNRCIILQGGMHAREYVTSFLLLKMLDYLSCFVLPFRVLICPIVNPDGVEICTKGKNYYKKPHFDDKKLNINKKLINKIGHFDMYKANGRGVDINVNFDCDWGGGKNNFFAFPYFQNYAGKRPNSESETKALISLTKKYKPFITISYHSKGEVVYYGYEGAKKSVKEKSAFYMKAVVPFRYKKAFAKNSTGGYKDYCIKKLDIPSFTIEVGNDSLCHPIKLDNGEKIFSQNKKSVVKLIKLVLKEEKCKKNL